MKILDKSAIPALGECVHCGLCVPSCPTHHATGREADSPRGRIAALRAVAEGRQQLSDAIHDGLENCLVCRACESACPSGISMETLMGRYRESSRPTRSDPAARLERWLLERVIASPRRLEFSLSLLAAFAPLLRLLPGSSDLPSARRLRRQPVLPAVLEATAPVEGTVVMLRGCVADRLFAEETLLAARLLAANGWRVLLPDAGCCGALHRHAGLLDSSRKLSRQCAEEMLGCQPDHVVIDSAGCAAHLDEPLSREGSLLGLEGKVTDSVSLLVRSGFPRPLDPLGGLWALAEPCHQKHSNLDSSPIAQAMGLALKSAPVALAGADHCCGAAGLYLLRRRALSHKIGQEALARFEATGAGGVITSNPGCLLRWEALLGAERVLSPIAVLARAGGIEGVKGSG